GNFVQIAVEAGQDFEIFDANGSAVSFADTRGPFANLGGLFSLIRGPIPAYRQPAAESRQAIESRPAAGSRLGGCQAIEAHSGRAHDVVQVDHRIGEIRRAEGSQQIADWSRAIDQELIEGVDGGFPLEREGLLLV